VGVLEIEQRDGVRRLRLNRPEKLNALSVELMTGIENGLRDAMADAATSVVVLSGAGQAFSAGHDVKDLDAPPSEGKAPPRHRLTDTPKDMVATRRRVDEWLALWAMPKPVIAQVHGYCLGLANELVGCCDLVVCGESSRFGMPEVRQVALFPTLGFWPDRVGVQRTKELLFTGRLVGGEEAVRLGLALECVPDEELEARVDALAASIAEVDVDRLTLAKAAVNAWAEARGVRSAAARGAEFHAIYHRSGLD
jgi:enoyl-CoA hydratase